MFSCWLAGWSTVLFLCGSWVSRDLGTTCHPIPYAIMQSGFQCRRQIASGSLHVRSDRRKPFTNNERRRGKRLSIFPWASSNGASPSEPGAGMAEGRVQPPMQHADEDGTALASSHERKRLWMAAIKPPMYSVGFVPVLVSMDSAQIYISGVDENQVPDLPHY